ncbi:hypothetical protein [Nannocystis sp.]|uniref:hypothetical protein n=1 Tax=Nannocystis sp. TaxID=1962667 RepID=UPI0025EA0EA6|nr:hypothetical protein [Nannocystis sp.]
MQLAAVPDLLAADHRDVVLGLAGDRAGGAAGAGVEVDDHAPLLRAGQLGGAEVGVDVVVPQRAEVLLGDEVALLGEVGVLLEALDGGLADDRARRIAAAGVDADGVVLGRGGVDGGVERAVVLRRVDQAAAAELDDIGAADKPGVAGGLQAVGVDARAVGDGAEVAAAVAEGERDGVVGLAGGDPHRGDQVAAADGDAEQVAVLDAELAGGGDADVGGVVPRQLGHRVRGLLQPAVVGVAAVGQLGVEVEVDLELAGVRLDLGEGADEAGDVAGARGDAGPRDALDHAVVQPAAPHAVGVHRPEDGAPVALDQAVAVDLGVAGDPGQELERRLAVVQRGDERLDDRDGGVGGLEVAPGLEVVRAGQAPLGELAGLVDVGTEVDQDLALERLGEAELAGGVVGGVRVEADDLLDRAVAEAGGQGGERLAGDRGVVVAQADGVAAVAERVVDEHAEGVGPRGLALTDEDGARAAGRLGGVQVLGQGDDELVLLGAELGLRKGGGEALAAGREAQAELAEQLVAECGEQAADLAAADPQAVVRLRAGDGEVRLDAVEAAHVAGVLGARDLAAVGVLAGEADVVEVGAEEVGVEGGDQLGAAEVVGRARAGAGEQLGAGDGVAGGGGVIGEDAGLGELLFEGLEGVAVAR